MSLTWRQAIITALANLLAAFGGGAVLGKSVHVVAVPGLNGASLIAFFVGMVLGLGIVFSRLAKKRINLRAILSVLGAAVSFGAAFYYLNFSDANGMLNGTIGVIFFAILCIRFSLWFVPRVMRSDIASGDERKLPFVEAMYYGGTILGLICWTFLGISFNLVWVLLLDATLQLIAGICDGTVGQPYAKEQTVEQSDKQDTGTAWSDIPLDTRTVLWKLAGLTVIINTLGQVVPFDLARIAGGARTSIAIAIFYSGVAVAALFSARVGIKLDLQRGRFGNIAISLGEKVINIGLASVIMLIIFPLLLTYFLITQNISFTTAMVSAFISALFLELSLLAIFNRLGADSKSAGYRAMVARTFCIMAIFAAVTMWTLSVLNNPIVTFGFILLMAVACLPMAPNLQRINQDEDLPEKSYASGGGRK